jgi:hypothetical protein
VRVAIGDWCQAIAIYARALKKPATCGLLVQPHVAIELRIVLSAARLATNVILSARRPSANVWLPANLWLPADDRLAADSLFATFNFHFSVS